MPTRRFILICAWLTLLSLGLSLRLNNLSERPMHADEATGARILADRLESKDYHFNPNHFHGPTLSLSSIPIAKLNQENSWPALSKKNLRIGPALAGTALLLIPLLWRSKLGQSGALLATTCLATSPLLTYYSRVYIHETWLTLFALLALTFACTRPTKPTYKIAAATGLCIGLMYATKETFIISILSWSTAIAATCLIHKHRPNLKDYWKPLSISASFALFTAAAFYSNGFQSLEGTLNAVRTYFVYETTPGHDKPFHFYLNQMLWPKHSLGTYWTEATIALLALVAVLRTPRSSITTFLAFSALFHIFIYSFISYKTPWLMLVPWAHLCLLAGFALKPTTSSKISTTAIALIATACLAFQTHQTIQATGRFENDTRTPYAYVPTSKDIESCSAWLTKITSNSQTPITIIGSDYWPLPWYLRSFENVGYWPAPQKDLTSAPIVLATPLQNSEVENQLRATHTHLPRGLRHNVALHVYIANELWQQWLDNQP